MFILLKLKIKAENSYLKMYVLLGDLKLWVHVLFSQSSLEVLSITLTLIPIHFQE